MRVAVSRVLVHRVVGVGFEVSMMSVITHSDDSRVRLERDVRPKCSLIYVSARTVGAENRRENQVATLTRRVSA